MRKANELSIILFETIKAKKAEPGIGTAFYDVNDYYSTVTDLARLRGWSTFLPLITAM